jgi:hypothetical protein
MKMYLTWQKSGHVFPYFESVQASWYKNPGIASCRMHNPEVVQTSPLPMEQQAPGLAVELHGLKENDRAEPAFV